MGYKQRERNEGGQNKYLDVDELNMFYNKGLEQTELQVPKWSVIITAWW